MSVTDRRQLINKRAESLSIKRQCELLGLNRSSYYYAPSGHSEETFKLMKMIDQIYTSCPYYGSRRIRATLYRQGRMESRGRIRRLMRLMGLEGKQPGRQTTRSSPEHRIYPNLLKNHQVSIPNDI